MTTGEEEGGAAERRVAEHLALLQVDAPEPSTALVQRIVRSARLHRLVRQPLRVAGMIASAALSGIATLLGVRRRR